MSCLEKTESGGNLWIQDNKVLRATTITKFFNFATITKQLDLTHKLCPFKIYFTNIGFISFLFKNTCDNLF